MQRDLDRSRLSPSQGSLVAVGWQPRSPPPGYPAHHTAYDMPVPTECRAPTRLRSRNLSLAIAEVTDEESIPAPETPPQSFLEHPRPKAADMDPGDDDDATRTSAQGQYKEGPVITLQDFLRQTSTSSELAVRRAMVAALSMERPDTRDAYGRFYGRVVSELRVAPPSSQATPAGQR